MKTGVVRNLVDRRVVQRRSGQDRRAEVRWEPEKTDRRQRGVAAERRKNLIWQGGAPAEWRR